MVIVESCTTYYTQKALKQDGLQPVIADQTTYKQKFRSGMFFEA